MSRTKGTKSSKEKRSKGTENTEKSLESNNKSSFSTNTIKLHVRCGLEAGLGESQMILRNLKLPDNVPESLLNHVIEEERKKLRERAEKKEFFVKNSTVKSGQPRLLCVFHQLSGTWAGMD